MGVIGIGVIGNLDFILDRVGKPVLFRTKTGATRDGYTGKPSGPIYQDLITVIGAFQDVSGKDLLKIQQMNVIAQHKLYVKFVPSDDYILIDEAGNTTAVTVDDQVLFKGRYYKITFIDNPLNLSNFLKIFLERDDNYVDGSN